MNNLAIVSACSDKYFHLFLELLHSIKKNVELKKIDICLIDNGLNEKNLSYIKKKVQIISPVIKFIKNSPVDPFEYVQLFLPKYFPNYKKYIWIDADCWLNSGSAIKMLIEASNKGYFAISSMGDRDCPGAMIRIDWLFRNMGIVKSQNIKHSFKLGLSTKEARYLGLKPHLNAGVFALDKKSIFWSTWIKNFKKLRGPRYGRAQLAMNYSVYIGDNKVNILPNYINCLISPDIVLNDKKKKKFVERYYPHKEIGIVHLAGKDIRFKDKKMKIKNLDNKIVLKSLRFNK